MIAERDRLNKELEQEHMNLKKLQDVVAELMKASANNTGSPVNAPAAAK